MHTLLQLKSGELTGLKRLTLSENLTEFPLDILLLADTLEILDLSNNKLTTLPKEIAQLKKLKILFASNNYFEALPEVLGQCENLEMVGFKSNKINCVPANALPAKLRWLIPPIATIGKWVLVSALFNPSIPHCFFISILVGVENIALNPM